MPAHALSAVLNTHYKDSGAGRDANETNTSLVMEDTLDQICKQENVMLPLNDEWLNWPPESMDSFFASSSQNSLATHIRAEDQHKPEKQPRQGNTNETNR